MTSYDRTENTAAAASVAAKLKRQSQEDGTHLNDMLPLFGTERLLKRLADVAPDQVVLKGGMLVRTWVPDGIRRATNDADLSLASPLTPEQTKDLFQSAAAAKTDVKDGVSFNPDSVKVLEIRGQQTGGMTVTIDGQLGTARMRSKVDIGFGDVVVPRAERIGLPPVLRTLDPIDVLSYRKETVVAEKFETIVWYGRANTRQKDVYDLAVLSDHQRFHGPDLRNALAATFEFRRTPMPTDVPSCLDDRYTLDELRQKQWAGFLRNNTRGADLGLKAAATKAWEFLEPAIAAARTGAPFDRSWDPAARTWEPASQPTR